MHGQKIALSHHLADSLTAPTDVNVAANAEGIHLQALNVNLETCRILQGIGPHITENMKKHQQQGQLYCEQVRPSKKMNGAPPTMLKNTLKPLNQSLGRYQKTPLTHCHTRTQPT